MEGWLTASGEVFAAVQGWLFEHLLEPGLHLAGMDNWLELGFDGVEFVLVGLIEVLLLLLVLRPLEAWRPAERWSDRRGVGVDVAYTLLHRLGVVPLLFFLILQPLADLLDATLRLHGYVPFTLESVLPGLVDRPVLTFMAYLLLLDFAGYWQHRFQHRLEWWWALHALHHSQRRMSLWCDDRNHLIDDALGAAWFALLALLIGVPPGQFLALALCTRVLQSLAHANLRCSFGRWGNCLIVSPYFHRVHHGIGIGHQGDTQGCNFAVLFPVWDLIFGTLRLDVPLQPTGIDDQLRGRDYGAGFWDQQRLGMQRLFAALPWSDARKRA